MSCAAFGQAALPIGATVGGNTLGYNTPSVTLYAAPQYDAKRFLLLSQNTYSPTGKVNAGGFNFGTDTRAYAKYHGFLLGGGVSAIRLITPQYTKGGVSPLLGCGFEKDGYRVTADYLFTGTDRRNYEHGIKFALELPLNKRLRGVFSGTVYKFTQTDVPTNHLTGGSVSAGLQFDLHKPH